MRTCLVMLFLLAAAHPRLARAEEFPDIQRLAEMVRDQRADIRDYECLYEGRNVRITSVVTSGLPANLRIANEGVPDSQAGFTRTFQGKFAFRNDEATHQDISLTTSVATEPMRRIIQVLFHGKKSSRFITPDRGGVLGPDASKDGSILTATNQTTTLCYVDMNPVLQATLNFREGLELTDAAWEDIDGHRCLVFSLGRRYGAEPPARIERYWVDLGRNAAVLKLERIVNGDVAHTIDGVRLERDTTQDGRTVWFPHAARIQWYDSTGKARATYLEATFGIIHGSLKINQNLADGRFSLDYGLSPEEIRVAHEFNTGKRSVAGSQGATHAIDALKKTIRDVDDPSGRLSARSDPSSGLGNYSGYILVAFGTVVLTASFLLRRRT